MRKTETNYKIVDIMGEIVYYGQYEFWKTLIFAVSIRVHKLFHSSRLSIPYLGKLAFTVDPHNDCKQIMLRQ